MPCSVLPLTQQGRCIATALTRKIFAQLSLAQLGALGASLLDFSTRQELTLWLENN
ncbi:MAG: DUF4351 domain-containing protein [Pseudanabaenales cyanobacterium]|nr:DUF4351 domain-containing protein [Pseudanabaenales cyanobacterium]